MTLITPSCAESEITGFLLAIERKFRGHLYRIEWWRAGIHPLRDGIPVGREWETFKAFTPMLETGKSLLALKPKA